MRRADPNAKLYSKTWSETDRVEQQQTGMARARHKSIPWASVVLRSPNDIQRA